MNKLVEELKAQVETLNRLNKKLESDIDRVETVNGKLLERSAKLEVKAAIATHDLHELRGKFLDAMSPDEKALFLTKLTDQISKETLRELKI